MQITNKGGSQIVWNLSKVHWLELESRLHIIIILKDSILLNISKKVYYLVFFTKFGYVLYLYWICCFVIRYFRLEMELLFLLTSLYGFLSVYISNVCCFQQNETTAVPICDNRSKVLSSSCRDICRLNTLFYTFHSFSLKLHKTSRTANINAILKPNSSGVFEDLVLILLY